MATRKRKILKRTAVVACVLLALPLLLLAVANTPPAKAWMASAASNTASGVTGLDIRIEGVSGVLPFTLGIGHLEAADEEGVFLEGDGASMGWAPRALFAGKLRINAVRVDGLALSRIPTLPESASEPSRGFSLPALPPPPRWLEIGNIDVGSLTLGEAVVGEESVFRIEGRAGVGPSGGWHLGLELERSDQQGTTLSLDAETDGTQLVLAMRAEDGSIVPGLLGLPGPLSLSLEGAGPPSAWRCFARAGLGGESLAGAQVDLVLTPSLSAEATVRLHACNPLLPPQVARYLGGDVGFALAVGLAGGEQFVVEFFDVTAQDIAVRAAGTVSLDTMTVEAHVAATHAAPHTFSGNAAAPVLGPLKLELRAEGPRDRLSVAANGRLGEEEILDGELVAELVGPYRAKGTLRGHPPLGLVPEAMASLLAGPLAAEFDVAYGLAAKLEVEALSLEAPWGLVTAAGLLDLEGGESDFAAGVQAGDLSLFSDLAQTPLSGRASLEAKLEGKPGGTQLHLAVHVPEAQVAATSIAGMEADLLATGGAWLKGDFAEIGMDTSLTATLGAPGVPAAEWRVEAEALLRELRAIEVAKLAARGPGLSLHGEGGGDLDARTAQAALSLETDLAKALAPFGFDAEGSGSLNAELVAKPEEDVFDANVSADFTGLRRLPFDAHRVVGERAALTAEATFREGAIHLVGGRIESPNLEAVAEGHHALDGTDTALTAQVSAADFAPLSALAGQDLGGAIEAHLEASGPVENLQVRADVSGQGLRANEVKIEQALLGLEADGVPGAAKGRIALRLEQQGKELSGHANFALKSSELALSQLEMAAGGNRITGGMNARLPEAKGKGHFEAALPDLAYLGGVLGIPLSGTIHAVADFDTGGPDPHATLTAEVASLESGGFLLTEADAAVRVEDPMGAPQIDATVTGAGIAAQGNTLDTVAAHANGGLDRLALEASWAGSVLDQVPTEGRLEALASADAGRIELDVLEGGLGGYPFGLEEPATLATRQGGYALDGLKLRVGEGRIEARGRVAPDAVEFAASLDALPVAMAQLLGAPEMQGLLAGAFDVSGTPGAPRGQGHIALSGFRLAATEASVPDLGATVETSLEPGLASITGTLDAPGAGQATWRAEVPLGLSLMPVAFEVPPGAPLKGALDAQFDVEALARALAPEGHVARGNLDADLELGGTIAAAELTGEVVLSEGYYENADTGTILDELRAVIRSTGNQVELLELAATDGTEGRLAGKGHVALAPGFEHELEVQLEDMRIVHRDDVTGRTSGLITVAGNLEAVKVAGNMALGPAILRMPDELPPPSLPKADVVEINGPNQDAAESTGDASSFLPKVTLDLKGELPRNVWVRAPVLDSEWEGALDVRGTAEAPEITGTLKVRRGYLDVLGRRFDLMDSSLNFDGNEDLMPYINVQGEARTRKLTARVRITGRPENLKFALDSEPHFPEDEVLAHVLFDRSLNDLTPLQAVQLARAAALLSGGMPGGTLMAGDSPLGAVDRLDVRAGENPGEAVVGVGKYITEDIYAEVEQGTGPASSKMRVQVEIRPQLTLEAETGSAGEQGMGMFWKKDY